MVAAIKSESVAALDRNPHLSQTALAAAAEISPGYLNEIEKDKKPGSVAALRKLAAVLNVPMENLAPPE